MKAVILGAGRGERMAPLTDNKPKILLDYEGVPLLVRQLRYLVANGFEEIAIVAAYLSDQVVELIDRGIPDLDGTTVLLSTGTEPRGTAAELIPIAEWLDETFLVLYGDVIASFHLQGLIEAHETEFTMCVFQKPLPDGYVLIDEAQDVVADFSEKPVVWVNAGIYMLEPEIVAQIEEGDDFGFNLIPRLIDEGFSIRPYPIDDQDITDIGGVYSRRVWVTP